jgi:8-oxo-dGTP pyrophosphatase MutT (NUDIX family)
MAHAHIEDRIILSGCLIISDNKKILLLYRSDHNHYETPGGKVRISECDNPKEPTINDLEKTAKRELYEELGKDIEIEKFDYFGKVKFTIPGGKLAIANKFLVKLTGNPKVNEPDKFSKFDYLTIEDLENNPISPDLKLLIPKLKEYVKAN